MRQSWVSPFTAIVLGREGDKDPNDGQVTAFEWTEMRLASELTVLSACDSGLGRHLPGEGIMGLPFALFVAGKRQTLLSLWPVPERSTARLITRFFELQTGGRTAAAASALTKHEFASQPGVDERVWCLRSRRSMTQPSQSHCADPELSMKRG